MLDTVPDSWLVSTKADQAQTALIDRLVHHAEILTIEGESYRRRTAEEARAKKLKSK